MARSGQERRGRAGLHDPAAVKHEDLVAGLGNGAVVRDEDERRDQAAHLSTQMVQEAHEPRPGDGVEGAGWLVGHQRDRAGRQGQGQGRALALTTGHLPRKARPQQPVKTCLAHHLLATLTCTTTVRPCRPGRPSHLGRDREQRVEGRRRVLAHEADPGRGLSPGGGLVQHLVPVDGQRPCCSQACRQRARDRRTGEGLPGARCSQDGQRSTLRHAAPHPGQQELRSTAARCLRHHPQVVENDCLTGRLYLYDTHYQYKRRPHPRARLGLRA